jgi:hypothetical protein
MLFTAKASLQNTKASLQNHETFGKVEKRKKKIIKSLPQAEIELVTFSSKCQSIPH